MTGTSNQLGLSHADNGTEINYQDSSFFSSPQAPPQSPFGASRPRALSSTSSGGRCRETRPPSTLTSNVAKLKPGLLIPLPVSRLYVFLWMGQATFGVSPAMPIRPLESTCSCLCGQEFCV